MASPKLKIFSFILIIIGGFQILESCTDDCSSRTYYTDYRPVYITTQEVRSSFAYLPPEEMSVPGKIYMLGDFLFVNEVGKGIHIINNTDKRNPINLGFINIPGNYDIAAKGNIIYADSYVDLLAIDISDVNDPVIVKRIESVFSDLYYIDFTGAVGEAIVVGYDEIDTVWYDNPECNRFVPDFLRWGGGFMYADKASGPPPPMANPEFFNPGLSAGIGGSMARFSIVNDIMYAVGMYNLRIFNIANIADPLPGENLEIGWDIETIFPYENHLFIGARNGMHIYDISEPTSPQFISTYEHIRSCDPVVVQDTIAFVTLRSGTACEGFSNQLDVIDIKNLYKPTLIKTYPMLNPHGLGIDGKALFICEGSFGLKIFDASDIYSIDKNQLAHYTGMHAFDVIPYNNILILIGEDGLYQYDYTKLDNISLLSQLPIIRPNN